MKQGSEKENLSEILANLQVGERLFIEYPKCTIVRDGYSFFSIETETLVMCNLTHKVVLDKLEKGLSYHSPMHDDEFFAAP